jgi:hypothetical protein
MFDMLKAATGRAREDHHRRTTEGGRWDHESRHERRSHGHSRHERRHED